MEAKLICNKCTEAFVMKLSLRTEGELEITSFRCPHCNEEYVVAVTDSALREAIHDYDTMLEEARTATDAETSGALTETARQMKEANTKRRFELMAEYKEKENGK